VPTLTPFQTVGPYLSLGLHVGVDSRFLPEAGQRIVIKGRMLDGAGQGIPDGVLEFWHASFTIVQRALTTEDGGFIVETVKPTRVAGPEHREQAPHLAVRVLGRGILTEYITRLYFDDETDNATDPILNLVPVDRRPTLIAKTTGSHEYAFDVVVQGENETVFFDPR
jgi:protocatechuate 3,4-dioxygenase, alpha subunit